MPTVPELKIGPTTSDGRLIIAPAVFSGNQNLNFPGEGDDLVNGNRGDGQSFLVDASVDTRDGNNNIIKEWQFLDHLYIDGGELFFTDGGKNDYLLMDIVAPATPSTPNGTATGNVNKVSTGLGFNVYIPALTLNGDTDIDYTSPLNGNVEFKSKGCPVKITQAVPVPAIAKDADGNDIPDGFWNYDQDTGELTPAVGGGGEKLGFYNLYDIEINLVRWVTRMKLWNFGKGEIQKVEYYVPVKAKKIFPHWVFRSTWHIEGGSPTFACHWYLYTAREHTT